MDRPDDQGGGRRDERGSQNAIGGDVRKSAFDPLRAFDIGEVVLRLCTMNNFTDMEMAALQAIFAENPGISFELQRQLDSARVSKRENTGGGFYTDISVPDDAHRIECANVLGYATHARVAGLEHGLGFVLFMKDGRLNLLEGFAWGPENTASLDLRNLQFEIYNQPIQRVE